MNRSAVKFLFIIAIIAMIATACSAPTTQPVSNSGGAGGEQAASIDSSSEQRIISTTVAVTQIADALGMELIGVPTSAKVLPAKYDSVKRVGSPMSPDLEIIKSLKPTKVLSVTTLKYDLEPKFSGIGLPAEFLDMSSLENMMNSIKTLGDESGHVEQAQQLAARYEEKIKTIEKQTEGKQGPTVLILLGVPGSYLVATEHSYIGDLVRLAGGRNIVQGEKVEFLASNTEYLQQSNPDVILRAAHGMPEEVIKMFDKEFQTNDIWKHFSAVQNGRVYDLQEELFGTTASLAADQALDELVQMLYPDGNSTEKKDESK